MEFLSSELESLASASQRTKNNEKQEDSLSSLPPILSTTKKQKTILCKKWDILKHTMIYNEPQ